MRDLAYLKLLSREYPNIRAAASDIINLQAICGLPKGTEYFFSDLHGEHEAFIYLLRSSSGIIREKIRETFGHIISEEDEVRLANLIYYPEKMINQIKQANEYTEDWQKTAVYRLVQICREVSSKYTRSKVRKKMPKEFSGVIDELLYVDNTDDNKTEYYSELINTLIDVRVADSFIVVICSLIRSLTIDNLHILGDIFDRGPRPDIILEELMHFHDVDIQWGNHDISWMGAATGNRACICNVLRMALGYNGFDVLEDGYGINLRPLSMFAERVYRDDPCTCFLPQILDKNIYDAVDPKLAAKMHKAIAVLQYKEEGQIIKRHPEFGLEKRNLLHHIDFERGVLEMDGKEYKMLDMNFPTVDPKDPYAFTPEEADIMERLERAFMNCEKLQQHMKFLLAKGSLYKVYNNNLLYHGCVPLNKDGTFKEVEIYGKRYKGKALYDILDNYVRKGFVAVDKAEREKGRDMMWYIWLNENSPLFGKDKMATFERYFLAEKETHKEKKNPYYLLLEDEKVICHILKEFGLENKDAHIINGHVPVKCKDGEKPIKCGGKVLVIDGGFSRAYQKETGIAGYTLIYNSYGLILAAHEPFESTEAAIEKESDIHSDSTVVKRTLERKKVEDTDVGRHLKEQIADLEVLLAAYRSGVIAERL